MTIVGDLKRLLSGCDDATPVGLTVKTQEGTVLLQGADIAEAIQVFPTNSPTYVQVVGIADSLTFPLATARAFAGMDHATRKMVLASLHTVRRSVPAPMRDCFETIHRALENDHQHLKVQEESGSSAALDPDGSARVFLIKRACQAT